MVTQVTYGEKYLEESYHLQSRCPLPSQLDSTASSTMPSRLMFKIVLKVFDKKTAVHDDTASVSSRRTSITMVNSRASTPPPTYSKASQILSEKFAEDEYAPSPSKSQPSEPCVQLCPHEKLSFERMQRILALPRLDRSPEGIDALGGTAVEQHITDSPTSSRTSWRTCQRHKGPGKETYGTVRLHYVSSSKSGNDGLGMRAAWWPYLDSFNRQGPSQNGLRQRLEDTKIQLCPHKKMSDGWTIDTLYKYICPGSVFMDLVDEWLVKEGVKESVVKSKDDCVYCGTTFEITGSRDFPIINVRRFLGQGIDADDPVWISQCEMDGKVP